MELGVTGIYGPGAPTEKIIEAIRQALASTPAE
jgi:methylmalonyl-CoA mutase cobalamin-binding subunit